MRRVVILTEAAEDLEEGGFTTHGKRRGRLLRHVTAGGDRESGIVSRNPPAAAWLLSDVGEPVSFGISLPGAGGRDARGGRARPAAASGLDSETGDGKTINHKTLRVTSMWPGTVRWKPKTRLNSADPPRPESNSSRRRAASLMPSALASSWLWGGSESRSPATRVPRSTSGRSETAF